MGKEVSVLANAIAYAWITTMDPERSTPREEDGTPSVMATEKETEAAMAAARLALQHLNKYQKERFKK